MSLSKSDIKFINSLGIKKYRQKYNKFVVEGDKMVRELLHQQRFRVETLYALPEWLQEQSAALAAAGIPAIAVTARQLEQLSQLATAHQVIAVVDIPAPPDASALPSDAWSLFLDGIQDPANLGAILRVADWFGIRQVVLGPDTVDVYNPKAIQASMGAFLRVSCPEASLAEVAESRPALLRVGAAMGGENVFTADLPAAGLLVIGREGPGIRPEAQAWLQRAVAVPAPANSGAESLNAAVAAGILCAVITQKAVFTL
jgi:TrmH family RNA methyltransferase